jgi:hypothetical protein
MPVDRQMPKEVTRRPSDKRKRYEIARGGVTSSKSCDFDPVVVKTAPPPMSESRSATVAFAFDLPATRFGQNPLVPVRHQHARDH